MEAVKQMRARELMRMAETKGWILSRVKGSHFQYTKNGRSITIVGPENNMVSAGVVRSVLKVIEEVG